MKRFLAMCMIVAVLTLAVVPALAAGSRSINQSCSNGAYAGISGSGQVTVTFYYTHWWYPGTLQSSSNVNLGGGQSRTVTTNFGASYYSVYVSGNASVVSAGCR